MGVLKGEATRFRQRRSEANLDKAPDRLSISAIKLLSKLENQNVCVKPEDILAGYKYP
jgi:hypothetical protein